MTGKPHEPSPNGSMHSSEPVCSRLSVGPSESMNARMLNFSTALALAAIWEAQAAPLLKDSSTVTMSSSVTP